MKGPLLTVFLCSLVLFSILHPILVGTVVSGTAAQVWNPPTVSETAPQGWNLPSPLPSIAIYVLQIDGVGSFPAINSTKVWQGVVDAGRNRTIMVRPDFDTFVLPTLHTTVKPVRDWETYKQLIVSQSNFIIVNGHYEYLPVPSGYSRERWLEAIGDALGERYAVWIHIAGYPFARVWYEDGHEEEWGPDGFSLFTGRNQTVTLEAPVTERGDKSASVSASLSQYARDWLSVCISYPDGRTTDGCEILFDLGNAYSVDLWGTYPIRSGLIERDDILVEMYSTGEWDGVSYYPSVALRYGKDNSETFGIYVHFSGEIFHALPSPVPFELDYARAIIPTYTALLAEIVYSIVRIWDADETIILTRLYGNPAGLREASRLLEEAQAQLEQGNYLKAAWLAKLSVEASLNPPPVSVQSLLVGLGAVAVPVVSAIVLRRRPRSGHSPKEDMAKMRSVGP